MELGRVRLRASAVTRDFYNHTKTTCLASVDNMISYSYRSQAMAQACHETFLSCTSIDNPNDKDNTHCPSTRAPSCHMGLLNETLGIIEKSQIRLLHTDDTSNSDKLHNSVPATAKYYGSIGQPIACSTAVLRLLCRRVDIVVI
jgi:hypothetical protein